MQTLLLAGHTSKRAEYAAIVRQLLITYLLIYLDFAARSATAYRAMLLSDKATWVTPQNGPVLAGSLSAAFSALSRAQVQAVYILGSPLIYAHRATLAQLALKARLSAIYEAKPFVDDGGFMS